jgi:precorrin-2 dehydrogenase/sirohydrochlorin ferrochelatase
VCSATEPESGDFHVPAVTRRGHLVVAIGTEGDAPAAARAVRLWLESQLDDAMTTWIDLIAEFRPMIQESRAGQEQREATLRQLCEPVWLEQLRREGGAAVRARMAQLVSSLVASAASV